MKLIRSSALLLVICGWAMPVIAVASLTGSADAARTAASVVRDKFEAVNRHAIEEIAAAYSEDAILTASDFCAPRQGRSEVVRTYRAIFASVPDIRAEISEVVAEGDRVAVRLTLRGTINGSVFALPLMNFFTVAEGQITRDDGIFDNGGRKCRP